MKTALPVDGQKKVAPSKQNTTIATLKRRSAITQFVSTPAEGRYFKVTPKNIDHNLFTDKRSDEQQETTRQIIVQALLLVDSNPEKYGKPFVTTMPEKTWKVKTVKEIAEIADTLGGHMANWVEQALEWAQRITNGHTWKDICNRPDTANWYRLVKWQNGKIRRIGGSSKIGVNIPASDVETYSYKNNYIVFNTVPLVVRDI